ASWRWTTKIGFVVRRFPTPNGSEVCSGSRLRRYSVRRRLATPRRYRSSFAGRVDKKQPGIIHIARICTRRNAKFTGFKSLTWALTRLVEAITACVQTGENTVDVVDLRRLYVFQRSNRPKTGAPLPPKLVGREARQVLQCFAERVPQEPGRSVVIRVRAVGRLGDDRVDDTQFVTVNRVGLERRGGLLGFGRIAPEDRGAALGRDHRVDRVLLHQHTIGDGDRDGASGAALADDAGHDRRPQTRHHNLRPGDRTPLPVLLGGHARVGPRRVD